MHKPIEERAYLLSLQGLKREPVCYHFKICVRPTDFPSLMCKITNPDDSSMLKDCSCFQLLVGLQRVKYFPGCFSLVFSKNLVHLSSTKCFEGLARTASFLQGCLATSKQI